MIACNIEDKQKQAFYSELMYRTFLGEAYLNPNCLDQFENVLLIILDKYINRYRKGKYIVNNFLKVFNIDEHVFTEPRKVSVLLNKSESDFNGAVNSITASIRHREQLKLYEDILFYNEYNTYFIRKKQLKLRPFIFIRDGVKCVRCHKENNLVTHHIKPVRLFGKSTMENLITLCEDCHKEIHRTKDEKYLVG